MIKSFIKVDEMNIPKNFLGYKCLYQIYDDNKIICNVLDQKGEQTGSKKLFTDLKQIEDQQDFWGVNHLLKTRKISKLLKRNSCLL